MTEPSEPSRGAIPGVELLRELDEWLAQRTTPPTVFDVVQTGNANLMGGYILRTFRQAAQEAVLKRDRVRDLRNLAYLSFGDPYEGERFLRTHSTALGRTPLEAAVESSDGFVDAIRALPPHVRSVALRLCDLVAGSWRLTDQEHRALFNCTADEFAAWTADPSATPDELVERVSLLLAIRKALATLLPRDEAASGWVKKPNSAPIFGGLTALDFMIRDGLSGIRLVHDYLEAQIWSV